MNDIILTPSDFVALVNQTLEFAYPIVVIEGELSEFKISKNKWVYFSLKDDASIVKFFGTIYQIPGPLEDGMIVRVVGNPRLHNRFGFSVNVQSVAPVGEGSIKKAADLLKVKLQKEGLFDPARKRRLPRYPSRVGLITAATSAAYADFTKIAAARWGGVEINVADVYVQGDQSVGSIIQAIENLNMLSNPPEFIVLIRGGGSLEDLAAFSDERVVLAVAASRLPMVVAIGHEVDESLAELAADIRASTPSNAAELIFPDKKHELANLKITKSNFESEVYDQISNQAEVVKNSADHLGRLIENILSFEKQRLDSSRRLAELFNPRSALKRGYAIVRKQGQTITKTAQVKPGDNLSIDLSDGIIKVIAEV